MLRILLACAFLALASVHAAAQSPTTLAAALAEAIHAHPQFGIFDDVEVEVEGTLGVLTGRVTSAEKKARLGECASQVPGVTGIRNDLMVLPASRADDKLRQRIARSVYGHPAFWSHAARRNPPIHVVVEGGHVTLTGTVETPAEAALARSLAGGLGELSLTSRLDVRRRHPPRTPRP